MKLVVFSANGSTGRLLTKQALAAGHIITGVTRHRELSPLRHGRLRVLLFGAGRSAYSLLQTDIFITESSHSCENSVMNMSVF